MVLPRFLSAVFRRRPVPEVFSPKLWPRVRDRCNFFHTVRAEQEGNNGANTSRKKLKEIEISPSLIHLYRKCGPAPLQPARLNGRQFAENISRKD
jgi:hypothetical protein